MISNVKKNDLRVGGVELIESRNDERPVQDLLSKSLVFSPTSTLLSAKQLHYMIENASDLYYNERSISASIGRDEEC